jgi:hypothetical protein
MPALLLHYFVVHGTSRHDDPLGTMLPDEEAALAQGTRIVRELKEDYGMQSAQWVMEVTEGARRVAWIDFGMVE